MQLSSQDDQHSLVVDVLLITLVVVEVDMAMLVVLVIDALPTPLDPLNWLGLCVVVPLELVVLLFGWTVMLITGTPELLELELVVVVPSSGKIVTVDVQGVSSSYLKDPKRK